MLIVPTLGSHLAVNLQNIAEIKKIKEKPVYGIETLSPERRKIAEKALITFNENIYRYPRKK